MDIDFEQLRDWIGREETIEDVVTAYPAAALAATLDEAATPPQPGDELPPLWHWLYFLPRHRQSELGPDGHARRGGFLPSIPLPRWMRAGGRFTFQAPIRISDSLRRVSTIEDVVPKKGRTGPLVFVVVRHEIHGPNGTALTEWHEIVYRDLAPSSAPAPTPIAAPSEPAWVQTIVPDDVLLFRYSALTFNGHRIHYDRRYVMEVEGYPGLIVHGPLLATLPAWLAQGAVPAGRMKTFVFKAIETVFDLFPFWVCGRMQEGGAAELWAETPDAGLAMQASATWRPG